MSRKKRAAAAALRAPKGAPAKPSVKPLEYPGILFTALLVGCQLGQAIGLGRMDDMFLDPDGYLYFHDPPFIFLFRRRRK